MTPWGRASTLLLIPKALEREQRMRRDLQPGQTIGEHVFSAARVANVRYRIRRGALRCLGQKTKNAVLTVKHNGVTIHDRLELKDASPGGRKEDGTPGP